MIVLPKNDHFSNPQAYPPKWVIITPSLVMVEKKHKSIIIVYFFIYLLFILILAQKKLLYIDFTSLPFNE